MSDTAPAPGWLSHRVPQVVAGVPPLTRQAPVQLGHRVEQISEAVLTELAAPGDAVALVAPWGRMRHLQAFIDSYLSWCHGLGQAPRLLRFDPTPAAAEQAARRAVLAGAGAVFLPSGRCEYSILKAIAAAGAQQGRSVRVVALGEGVVEAAFGPSVGYLSLEGAGCAELIAQAVMGLLAGDRRTRFIELPWRLAAPARCRDAQRAWLG